MKSSGSISGFYKFIFKFSSIIIFAASVLNAQSVEDRITQIISQMTLQEKILQLHQEGGFNTADNTRLNIPGIIMSDGPHGVRNGYATSFPVSIGMAATWDANLINQVGAAMGQEFRGKGINQMLGPSMDICRDPRYGRSPESGGEDSYLTAQITLSLIKGAQSVGCMATAKHYNANGKENNRTNNNVIISQRNLIEEFGINFRSAVQDGGAFSVMNAYNLINGQKCAENYNLLTTILRNDWGFPFYVVSDWGSIWNSQNAIIAGCNIDMGDSKYQTDLYNLVIGGSVTTATIDDAVKKVLRTKILAGMMNGYLPGDPADVNSTAHKQLCLQAGRESLVLLKNQNNILPLNKNTVQKILVVGPSAAVCQTDASGSSWVSPFYSVAPVDGLINKIGSAKVLYSKGCDINSSDTSGFADALSKAASADYVIYVGGLDGTQEGEGFDRVGGSINLPGQQQSLINRLSSVNKNLICVIESGGICGLNDCIQNIKGLIYGFYPGQEGGNAIAGVIFGDYNPGGKLPVTMPLSDLQLPDYNLNYDDDYGCGYRWFDKMNLTPQFAFGFGLSYTSFSYSNLQISPASAPMGQIISVSADVTNAGSLSGDEVVQLYLSDTTTSITMPLKQLKGFQRINLVPGETKTVIFQISPNELYYFDETANAYKVHPGTYSVMVGGSSDNLPLTGNFSLTQADLKPDLKIANIYTVPPYPIKSDTVQFLATIINRGTGASPEGVIHNVTFSLNGQEICTSTEFNHSIPAGGMALVYGNASVNGSNSWIAANTGSYNVQATVNVGGIISETTDTNNTASKVLKVYNTPPVNLALKKLVTASSIENSTLGGSNAVDGDLTTRWSSQFSDPQYIIVDLGSVQQFNEIILVWETAYGKEYLVQTSNDDVTWITLSHVTNGSGGTEKIVLQGNARFVRIYGIKRATQWGYSLYEVEIYNDPNITSIEPNKIDDNIPTKFVLYNNYPNPFNPTTTIEYDVAKAGFVKIEIFNCLGELISTPVNSYLNPGRYNFTWSGKDANGNYLPSGIYFYRLSSPGVNLIKKMLMLK
ncbi:MAG: glycoside hydrolase family 3 C-terminal domain-containing protein [Bacteroidetes bacterium]|nr:glycoside hydrolase family 3 C-terminal domain-containing protein [Bacteroidota bacterium]